MNGDFASKCMRYMHAVDLNVGLSNNNVLRSHNSMLFDGYVDAVSVNCFKLMQAIN